MIVYETQETSGWWSIWVDNIGYTDRTKAEAEAGMLEILGRADVTFVESTPFEKWWWSYSHPVQQVTYWEDTLAKHAAKAAWDAARVGERNRGLAIYQRGFEENWVVQDVLDTIRRTDE